FDVPSAGYNDHFWYSSRGTYAAGTVDGVYVQMDMKATDPNANLVASVGADWWRDASAPFLQDHSNNPGIGSSHWVKPSTQWQNVVFSSMRPANLEANPPPPLLGSAQSSPTVSPTQTSPVVSPDTLAPAASNVTSTPDTGAATASSQTADRSQLVS